MSAAEGRREIARRFGITVLPPPKKRPHDDTGTTSGTDAGKAEARRRWPSSDNDTSKENR